MRRIVAHRAHEPEHLAVRTVVDEPVDEARAATAAAGRTPCCSNASGCASSHASAFSSSASIAARCWSAATSRAPTRPIAGAHSGSKRWRRASRSITSSTSSSPSRVSMPRAATDASAVSRSALAGVGEPAAEASRDADRAELAEHDLVGEELVLDERAEGRADLVLAGRDDRRVRDAQAERIPEQRRHREPVGDRADHGALGGGAHVAEPGHLVLQGERDREHDGGHGEQRGGDAFHAPQRVASLGIGGHGAPFGGRGHRAGHSSRSARCGRCRR